MKLLIGIYLRRVTSSPLGPDIPLSTYFSGIITLNPCFSLELRQQVLH